MTVQTIKYQEALDIALMLAQSDDTQVTEDDVQSWHEYDVYEWLEAWDYEWIAGSWEYTGEEINEV